MSPDSATVATRSADDPVEKAKVVVNQPGTGEVGASQVSAQEQPLAKEQRRTRQRAAVDEVLDETEDFISAQDLHAILRSRGVSVGLATVYRTLQTLADNGQVDVLHTAGGEAAYRRCVKDEHHHHLVCRSCKATVEVAGPAVERWTSTVAKEHGYVDVAHTLEIFGTCPRCASLIGSANSGD